MSYEALIIRRDEIDAERDAKRDERTALAPPDEDAFRQPDGALDEAAFAQAQQAHRDDLARLADEIAALEAERPTVNDQIDAEIDANGWPKKAVDGDPYRIEGDELIWLQAMQAQAEAKRPEHLAQQVNEERDRRIAAGFSFQGALFQTDADSVKRIAGAASAAHIAVTLDGAAAGDLRWADPDSDFGWIAEDNSLVPMDAPTVIAFGQAYMAHERALVFAAKAIKDRLRAGEAVDIESAPEWP